MVEPLNFQDWRELILKRGSHTSREKGMCMMEAVAWLAGKPHTDSPPCASPMIGNLLRGWNDGYGDDDARRTRVLLPFAPRIVGTVGASGHEVRRSFIMADWIVREAIPMALELVGEFSVYVARLRDRGELVNEADVERVLPLVREAGQLAWARWTGLRDGLRAGLRAGLRDGLSAGLRDGLSAGLSAGLRAGLRDGLRDKIPTWTSYSNAWHDTYGLTRQLVSNLSGESVGAQAEAFWSRLEISAQAMLDRLIRVTECVNQ